MHADASCQAADPELLRLNARIRVCGSAATQMPLRYVEPSKKLVGNVIIVYIYNTYVYILYILYIY